ncbi:MAG: UDP-glucose 4-epimerase GalE [Candidatus Methylacidiphilales bacterium]|nr:UDP-glucose 4-epimerase GalE [Candidatus Methylacidiphilales bacterium]
MKILVTGGAGYIGSICTEEILNLGDSVVVFDNLTEGHRAAIDPRAKFIEGDLADRDLIFKTLAEEKPDAVMHFAANALVGESMTNPSKYFRNNVGSGINLIDAMVDANVKQFVFSSTCATYGIPDRVPIDETLPQNPINPYGESKLMFEHVLKWYEKLHGLTHVNLRYFNAAGASEKFGEDHRIETHLIPNVLKVALGQRERVDMFGNQYNTPDGTCIRDYIHVKDLSAAHLLAITARKSAAYNLGTGEGFSVQEVVNAARKITGHEIPAVVKEARPGDPARLISSSIKIATELGWKPKFNNIEPILETAWAWHVKYPNGYGD